MRHGRVTPYSAQQHANQLLHRGLELVVLSEINDGVEAAVEEDGHHAELVVGAREVDLDPDVERQVEELVPRPAQDEAQAYQDEHPDGVASGAEVFRPGDVAMRWEMGVRTLRCDFTCNWTWH